jgi:RNA-binding protein
MTMRGKDRAALRAEAHHLSPTVHVGHLGITPSLLDTLDDALRTRELVKVQVSRNADLSAKEAAADLSEQMRAEVVQVIGRTLTLYRYNPELDRKDGEAPWRR